MKKAAKALSLFVIVALIAVPTVNAGIVDGPVADTDKVEANDSVFYNEIFKGGEVAAVSVSGDGDTDLDLFVYDENGNLVASDDDTSDQCIVAWVPNKTQRYRIVIKNLGDVYNEYRMIAN